MTPFQEFWKALNSKLHDLAVVEANFREAKAAYDNPYYSGLDKAADGVIQERWHAGGHSEGPRRGY